MTLNPRQTRFLRWCSDKYDDPRPIRWLKDRLYYAAVDYFERRIPVQW
jgi:hypothetical protein